MALRETPAFTKPLAGDVAQISTANTNRDGSGTLGTLSTGVADGKRVDCVRIKAIVTTTAGMVRFYYSPDNGVTNRLIGEVSVIAITVDADTGGFEYDWIPPGGFIDLVGTDDLLRASTHNAEAFNLYARTSSYAD